MAEIKSGAEAAREVGVALAVLYNYIKSGKVTNRKAGGWPLGRGIEVDMDEVRAAASAPRKARAPKGSRKAKEAIQGQLEAEKAERTVRRAREQNATGDNPHAVRLTRYQQGRQVVCPVNPSHYALLSVEKAKGDKVFHCAHQEHDGRSAHMLGGFSPQTMNFFSKEETEIAQPAGRLGVIMLEMIYNGRPDLAESLEAWCNENNVPVWLPER